MIAELRLTIRCCASAHTTNGDPACERRVSRCSIANDSSRYFKEHLHKSPHSLVEEAPKLLFLENA